MSKLDFKNFFDLRVTVIWIITLIYFFPIFWMFLTSIKTEMQSISIPPLVFFEPTLENFFIVQERTNYLKYAFNSIVTSVCSTILGLLIAIPAAYSFAFAPSKYTRDILLWMLSTKMMPAVGVLMPIYLITQKMGLLDTKLALIIIFAMMNLPIMIWMLFSYFREIPKEILEAVRIDGASTYQQIRNIVLPLSWGGLTSTALLSIVLSWNEAFWSINLTADDAGTLTALVASFSKPEGLYWAKLSAVSVMSCGPIIVLGWFTQKQLVRGLTFGAVK
mgnify:FL=1|tara:strand:- start:2086 stop:2913 length:828 start_codon:yes stop_codon:yes gene_type:complete